MIDALRKRLEKDEEGFTLIELMVVVLIIGILVAIAVPTFLNAQNNAKSKAAQSNARAGLSAAKTVHSEKESYDVTITELRAAEPSLGWTATEAAASVTMDNVSWDATATLFRIAVRAKNGDCFIIEDNVAAGGTGTRYGKLIGTSATSCTSDAPVGLHNSQTAGWPSGNVASAGAPAPVTP